MTGEGPVGGRSTPYYNMADTGEDVHQLRSESEVGGSAARKKTWSTAVLLVAMAVAAVIRTLWARSHGLALEQEGVEYARIAQNLLAGRGYVGLFNSGTQLNFPPLYPLLIAAVSLLVGSAEWAARAINIVLGSVLVIPMFKIAGRLYRRRVAVTVLVLVVLHPLLIAGSASSYSEGPYLTILMFAVLNVSRWLTDRSIWAGVWAGLCLGLDYLIRPEAFVIAGAFVAGGLVAAAVKREHRALVPGALALAGTFVLLAVPNVVFLTRSTGMFRIEAKGTLAYQWGSRMNAGMSYMEAANGIGEDLSDQGVFMRPNLEVITSASPTLRESLAFGLKAARRNVGPILRTIMTRDSFGSPILFGLVLLGLFRSSWDRRRALLDGVLLATGALCALVLFSVQALWFRYFYSLLGFMIVWGGKGADELIEWARGTVSSFTTQARVGDVLGRIMGWGAIAAVLALSFKVLPEESQFAESLSWERAKAGRWLAQYQPGSKWIMDSGLQVSYYANGDLIFLPYAGSDLALRYVAKKAPDFIVLESRGLSGLPYTAQWWEQGIPDPRAQLVYDEGRDPDERIKIYRWTGAMPPAR